MTGPERAAEGGAGRGTEEMPAGRRARPVTMTFCPDGPVIVRGDVTFTDDAGRPVPTNRRTVALCRCGGSAIKPWCDGTHKVNGFRAP